MRAPGCSSIGLWTLFVICGLFVIAYANIDNDDDEWNYDPTTKRMRKPTEADEHKKKVVTTFQQPTCLPVFRRFLSKLLKESAKLGLPDDANKLMHYDAVVKLSKQSVSEINKLLREDNDWTTGAMDEALSQILVEFKHHDPEAWKWQFEDTFYVELDTVLKLVFAEHQKNVVQMESVNAKCTGAKQTDWKESLTEWFRHKWTLLDHQYEMKGARMQTVAVTLLSCGTTSHSWQDIIEFLRALLTHLPLLLQIAVLLVIAGAIFVFMYGSPRAVIQHAIPLPGLGERRDPPPPVVEQCHAPRLRENEYWVEGDAPQPLQDSHHNNINHVRNQDNHGFGAGDANANAPQPNQEGIRTPQPRDRKDSMDIEQNFLDLPGDVQTVRFETLQSTVNMSSQDKADCQQSTEDQDPGIERCGEPEAEDIQKEKEKEQDVSTKNMKEQTDAQTHDKSETEPNVPSNK